MGPPLGWLCTEYSLGAAAFTFVRKMFEVKNLSKSYKKKQILKDLSFTAEDGEIIGILGANGCGKSTLLFALANLPQKCGYVPQNSVLIEELSARDNLRLWYKKSDLEKALQKGGVVHTLGINSFLDLDVSKMSGGMKKRLSIACAVADNPKTLLLDEPSSALDIPCKEKLYDYYRQFSRNGGIIILVTHDAEELSLCTRSFILKNGSLSPYKYDGDFYALSSILQPEKEGEKSE